MSLSKISIYNCLKIIKELLFIHLINDIYGLNYDIVIIRCKIVVSSFVNDKFIISNDLLSPIFDLITPLRENSNIQNEL
jgi:hypothetical protein